jgi:hypothetical protein
MGPAILADRHAPPLLMPARTVHAGYVYLDACSGRVDPWPSTRMIHAYLIPHAGSIADRKRAGIMTPAWCDAVGKAVDKSVRNPGLRTLHNRCRRLEIRLTQNLSLKNMKLHDHGESMGSFGLAGAALTDLCISFGSRQASGGGCRSHDPVMTRCDTARRTPPASSPLAGVLETPYLSSPQKTAQTARLPRAVTFLADGQASCRFRAGHERPSRLAYRRQ